MKKAKKKVSKKTTKLKPKLKRGKVDLKAKAWAKKNPWFGVNERATGVALAIHERLVKRSIDTQSDKYYKSLDRYMRRYWKEEDRITKRVALMSKTQRAMAKAFGMNARDYAAELLFLEKLEQLEQII